MDHIFPCSPQGGKISSYTPAYIRYSTKGHLGGTYSVINIIEFALGYSRSTNYRVRAQLQLQSVLSPMVL